MKKQLLALGILALFIAGCGGSFKTIKYREDITDMTAREGYKQQAKEFLNDGVVDNLTKVPDKAKAEAYCKSFSELQNYCNNFLTFAGSLNADERRKLIIFLGNDYFSANWMKENFAAGKYPSDMAVGQAELNMVADGFKNTPPNVDLEAYLKNRIDWQSRNSGIAFLAWLNYKGINNDYGLLNPETMEVLQKNYALPRHKGFADKMLNRPTSTKLNKVPKSFELVNVWGGTETIMKIKNPLKNTKIKEARLNGREKFLPSGWVTTLYTGLNKANPDFAGLKMVLVDGITDDMLQEVKEYAQWLSTQPDVKK